MSAGEKPRTQPSTQVSIKISDEIHKGVYANQVIIAHSRDEFVIDFVADFPPGAQIVSRVITSPAHAAALLDALGENLHRYERNHGAIRRGAPQPPASA
jgi:hypothetical protein